MEKDYEDEDNEPKRRSKPRRTSRKSGSNTTLLVGLIGGAVGLVLLVGGVGLVFLLGSSPSTADRVDPTDEVTQEPPFIPQRSPLTDFAKSTSPKKDRAKQPNQAARGTGVPNYLPLTQGNRWEYETGEGISKYSYMIEVARLTPQDGRTVVQLRGQPGTQSPVGMMGREEDGDVLLVDAKGVYRTEFSIFEFQSPVAIINFPIRSGVSTQNVQAKYLFQQRFTVTMTVTENVPIEVPAGTFNTVQVEISFAAPMTSTSTVTTWYADGVGMVKQRTVINIPETTVLKSYRLR